MDIVFKNDRLAKEFNDEKALRRERGPLQAKLIMQRLMELNAAPNLEVMRSIHRARCHELTNRASQLSVDLNHPYRLIFVPDHDPLPVRPEGGLDWEAVRRIRILGVEDTHK